MKTTIKSANSLQRHNIHGSVLSTDMLIMVRETFVLLKATYALHLPQATNKY